MMIKTNTMVTTEDLEIFWDELDAHLKAAAEHEQHIPALTYIPGIGSADHCSIDIEHRPTPWRFIWHHELPLACGGKTRIENLVCLCDNCHYTIHIMLWQLANNIKFPRRGNKQQVASAVSGFNQAVVLGTAGKIPKEA